MNEYLVTVTRPGWPKPKVLSIRAGSKQHAVLVSGCVLGILGFTGDVPDIEVTGIKLMRRA